MKGMFHLGLAALVAGFLAMPAPAGQGNHSQGAGKSTSHAKSLPSASSKASTRSNKAGKVKGLERAEEVQGMNKRDDAQRGFTVAPGVEKAESKQAGKASVKGGKKSHTPKGLKNN
jgi:hypothetical protein